MKFQSGPGFCGPAAVVNCLRALGIKVREEQVAQYAGTTAADGTTEHGLMQALERYECSYVSLSEKKYSAAEEALFGHISSVGPAIILSEAGDHWVSAIGAVGDRLIVFDSQNYRWNKAENGVVVLQRGEQLRRYWLPYQSRRYAILVHKGGE